MEAVIGNMTPAIVEKRRSNRDKPYASKRRVRNDNASKIAYYQQDSLKEQQAHLYASRRRIHVIVVENPLGAADLITKVIMECMTIFFKLTLTDYIPDSDMEGRKLLRKYKDACRSNDTDKVRSVAMTELQLPAPSSFKGKNPSEVRSREEVRELMASLLNADTNDLNTNAAVSLLVQYLVSYN
jgi:hypothetical protein